MIRRNKGFTLVEMLVVVAIFGFVIAGTSQMFSHLLRSYRQQSRISQTNIEGLIGLEIMRQDLEKAGYGLPWNPLNPLTNPFDYKEKEPNTLNLNDSPSNAPRGIIGYSNVTGETGIPAGTDYLAIKATSLGASAASAKWSFLLDDGSSQAWTTTSNDNFDDTDHVIVISPGGNSAKLKRLVSSGTRFSSVSSFTASIAEPETRVIYGVHSDTTLATLRMPFNRVDYFVKVPAASSIPKRCASKAVTPEDRIGILYKAVVNQDDGKLNEMPVLDCVADMQVLFKVDTDEDGVLENIDDITGMDAEAIRKQVKEVRVLILAHEGQRDPQYVHPLSTIPVKDEGLGRDYDLTPIKDWKHYRWKVYRISVKFKNLN